MSPLDRVLPPDITTLDLVAFAWFVFAWVAFNYVQDHVVRRSVNRHMVILRKHWMRRMLQREVRLPDTMLLGHSMQSCSFFASSTVLVLAALVGFFGAADHAHELLANVTIAVKTSLALFEMKIVIQGCIFIYAFFKFTWALREFNYCVALIGAAPMGISSEAERNAVADPIAAMMTLALSEFNAGIRAYYFALAGLGWLVDPVLYMVVTAGVVLVLARRQLVSRAERILRGQLEKL